MTQRIQWLKTRRQLLTQIKRQVRHRLGPESTELQKYIQRYNREFQHHWRAARDSELHRALARSEIALGADFHAFSQSQRIHLRILREVVKTREVVLVLEAVSARFQRQIDLFIDRKITEKEFLDRVSWEKVWGFPWENYKPLFDFAREQRLAIKGLDQGRSVKLSLRRRDQIAARQICALAGESKSALVYVVIGDLHLAAAHLPRAIKNIGREMRLVKILQNSEHLYFRLAERGKEHRVETLTSGRARFCVLSSPPWVKWQSYLIFLEQKYSYDLENDLPDLTEELLRIGKFLSQELQIKVDFSRLKVSSLGESAAWVRQRSQLSPKDRLLFDEWVARERSFLLPQSHQILLVRQSLNHLASLSGQYIHALVSRRRRLSWNFPQDLMGQIWIEAVGFFFSKLVNHRRKTESYEDLKSGRSLVNPQSSGAREVLRLVLAQKLTEHSSRALSLRTRVRERASYLEAGRILGGLLGEDLYEAYREQMVSAATLKAWLRFDPTDKDFRQHYLKILKELRRLRRGRR